MSRGWRIRVGLAALLLLGARAAWADETTAQACARDLPADAEVVFRDSAPDVTKDSSLREVLTTHMKRLIAEGRISLFDARPAATKAAACLQKLQD